MTKTEILTQALPARYDEVLHYQINIDNYRLAIERIDALDDETLAPFRAQLVELLTTSIYEQKKAKIMLEVLEAQLKE